MLYRSILCIKSGNSAQRGIQLLQVKGVATTTGARPWQETDLEQATWNQFLKVGLSFQYTAFMQEIGQPFAAKMYTRCVKVHANMAVHICKLLKPISAVNYILHGVKAASLGSAILQHMPRGMIHTFAGTQYLACKLVLQDIRDIVSLS